MDISHEAVEMIIRFKENIAKWEEGGDEKKVPQDRALGNTCSAGKELDLMGLSWMNHKPVMVDARNARDLHLVCGWMDPCMDVWYYLNRKITKVSVNFQNESKQLYLFSFFN